MKRLNLMLLISGFLFTSLISAKEYHVSVKGNDSNNGSALKPFINYRDVSFTLFAK